MSSQLVFVAIFFVAGLFIGADEPTGVARSLAIIERQITHDQVAKNELPARDRILVPAVDRHLASG